MSGIGLSYKQHPLEGGPWDAIVVGSGLGGLAAAAVLARQAGHRVLVLERHTTAGGYTHTFRRKGYEWDVGVHYVGQVGEQSALRPLFDYLSEGRLSWSPLPDVYEHVYLGEQRYDYVRGTGNFIAKLSEYFPSQADAIARYAQLVRSIPRKGLGLYIDRALPPLASRLMGRWLSRKYLKVASRTTAEVLGELTRDPVLAAVLTAQWGDYGLPPTMSSFAMHAGVAAHYMNGAWYPTGGSSAIARSIAPTFEARGGRLYVGAEVERVLVEGGRAVGVRLVDGQQVRAPRVISDAGLALTLGRLLPGDSVPAEARAALSRETPSASYFCLYLGFRHTDAELGLSGTNLWLYPDEKHDENVKRFAADPEAPLPVVYASFPSAKDPTFAQRFPGRAAIDVITMAPFEWFEKWKDTRWHKRGPDYEAFKERMKGRMLEALFARLPQLRGKVDHAELSTPLSVRHFMGHPRGELYGLNHSPVRYTLPIRAELPLKGLYLTGADLVSCGVAGAAMGGLVAASAILSPTLIPRILLRKSAHPVEGPAR